MLSRSLLSASHSSHGPTTGGFHSIDFRCTFIFMWVAMVRYFSFINAYLRCSLLVSTLNQGYKPTPHRLRLKRFRIRTIRLLHCSWALRTSQAQSLASERGKSLGSKMGLDTDS